MPFSVTYQKPHDAVMTEQYVHSGFSVVDGVPVVEYTTAQHDGVLGVNPLTGAIVKWPAAMGEYPEVHTTELQYRLAAVETLVDNTDTSGLAAWLHNANYAFTDPAWDEVKALVNRIVVPDSRVVAAGALSAVSGYVIIIRLVGGKLLTMHAPNSIGLLEAVREILCFGSFHTNIQHFFYSTAHAALLRYAIDELGWNKTGNSTVKVVDDAGREWNCIQTIDGESRHITFYRKYDLKDGLAPGLDLEVSTTRQVTIPLLHPMYMPTLVATLV